MCYSVIVDHNCMAGHVTRSDCERFEELLYIQCSGWDYDDMLWNDSEEDGNVGLSVRSMKAPDCEDGDSNTDCKGR